MIRTFLPVTFLFSSVAIAASNPTPTWSKSLVNDLKTKTIGQTFCEGKPGFQTQALCDHFKKNKINLDHKITLSRVNDTTLSLNDGQRSVEIKRTSDPLKFEINRKTIDMDGLREPQQLLSAINKVLPKIANHSFWMNQAVAADDFPGVLPDDKTSYGLMVNSLSILLNYTVDNGLCKHVDVFVNACVKNIADHPHFFGYENSLKNRDKEVKDKYEGHYLRTIVASSDELYVQLVYMERVIGRLNSTEVRSRLKMCPSSFDNANALEDINQCLGLLDETKKAIKTIKAQTEPMLEAFEARKKVEDKLKELAGSSGAERAQDKKPKATK